VEEKTKDRSDSLEEARSSERDSRHSTTVGNNNDVNTSQVSSKSGVKRADGAKVNGRQDKSQSPSSIDESSRSTSNDNSCDDNVKHARSGAVDKCLSTVNNDNKKAKQSASESRQQPGGTGKTSVTRATSPNRTNHSGKNFQFFSADGTIDFLSGASPLLKSELAKNKALQDLMVQASQQQQLSKRQQILQQASQKEHEVPSKQQQEEKHQMHMLQQSHLQKLLEQQLQQQEKQQKSSKSTAAGQNKSLPAAAGKSSNSTVDRSAIGLKSQTSGQVIPTANNKSCGGSVQSLKTSTERSDANKASSELKENSSGTVEASCAVGKKGKTLVCDGNSVPKLSVKQDSSSLKNGNKNASGSNIASSSVISVVTSQSSDKGGAKVGPPHQHCASNNNERKAGGEVNLLPNGKGPVTSNVTGKDTTPALGKNGKLVGPKLGGKQAVCDDTSTGKKAGVPSVVDDRQRDTRAGRQAENSVNKAAAKPVKETSVKSVVTCLNPTQGSHTNNGNATNGDTKHKTELHSTTKQPAKQNAVGTASTVQGNTGHQQGNTAQQRANANVGPTKRNSPTLATKQSQPNMENNLAKLSVVGKKDSSSLIDKSTPQRKEGAGCNSKLNQISDSKIDGGGNNVMVNRPPPAQVGSGVQNSSISQSQRGTGVPNTIDGRVGGARVAVGGSNVAVGGASVAVGGVGVMGGNREMDALVFDMKGLDIKQLTNGYAKNDYSRGQPDQLSVELVSNQATSAPDRKGVKGGK